MAGTTSPWCRTEHEYPKIVIAADDIYEHIHWGPLTHFARFAAACPELYKPHSNDERCIEGVCNDGLAHRLRGGPQRARNGYENDPEPEHIKSLQRLAGCGYSGLVR